MTIDLQITTNSFVEQGGPIFGRHVLDWNIRKNGIQVRTNVKKPQAMAKLSAKGQPQPYAAADNTAGNGPKITDRVLTVYGSKWDFDFDAQDFRNTYLADLEDDTSFVDAANAQVAREYLSYLTTATLYNGVRNAAGVAPADICDGFAKIIATEITATNLVPIVTGAITAANAVTQVELVAESVPTWMREYPGGFIIHCSYNVFDKYKKHYRSLNAYAFKPDETGKYKLDGINAVLQPQAMMGNSQRLIATIDGNLVVGTDTDSVEVFASLRRNIIEVRQLMPLGVQIQDLEALFVNDQA
jgi:hypothetical protein